MANLLDDSSQLVTTAESDEDARWLARPPPRQRVARPGQQPVDLGLSDPMMSALSSNRSDVAFVDPLLEGGVRNTETFGRLPDCHDRHI